ncbi:hypothetical protein Hanom_Chr09g00784481 [Helianthus anomalus]
MKRVKQYHPSPPSTSHHRPSPPPPQSSTTHHRPSPLTTVHHHHHRPSFTTLSLKYTYVKQQIAFFLRTAKVWSTSSSTDIYRCGSQTAYILPFKKQTTPKITYEVWGAMPLPHQPKRHNSAPLAYHGRYQEAAALSRGCKSNVINSNVSVCEGGDAINKKGVLSHTL